MTEQEQLHMACAMTEIGLCGCGSSSKWDVILSVLERAADESHSFYEPIGNAPSAWVEVLAMFLDAAGFLEHGTGIGWAWLTPKGNAVLGFLRHYGTADEKWPEDVCGMVSAVVLPGGTKLEGDSDLAAKIRFDAVETQP